MAVIDLNTTVAKLSPVDDIVRRFKDIVHQVIQLESIRRQAAKRNTEFSLTLSQIRDLPSRVDCALALKKPLARVALGQCSIDETTFFAFHNRLAPAVLRAIYQGLRSDHNTGIPDLPERFAQAVFEAGAIPPAKGEPHKLYRVLNEDNPERFAWVRGNLKSAFTEALIKEVERRDGGLSAMQEKFAGERSSRSFIDEVSTPMSDRDWMRLAHMIELSGFDLEDPEIIQSVLFEPK